MASKASPLNWIKCWYSVSKVGIENYGNFFIYIIYSKSHNRYYIGQTNSIEERLNRHNSGYERSTKSYIPWELKGHFEKQSRSEAMILEKKLKNLNTEDLQKLIAKYFDII